MLRIKNVVMLDLTQLTEETAKTIEMIDNCVTAFFSSETVKLMPLIPFKNLVKSVVLDKDARLMSINGICNIHASDLSASKQYLNINGKLIIDRDVTPNQLASTLVGGHVNGIVLSSAAQSEALKGIGLNVNGRMEVYPDGAILHTQGLKIDEAFTASAEPGSIHYALGDIDARDADLKALGEKHIELYGKRLLIYEDAFGDACAVYKTESGDIIRIPRGMRYVKDDITLDYATLRRLGKRIFLAGDCFIADDLTEDMVAAHLEKLVIKGRLVLSESIMDSILNVADDFTDLITYTGRLIKNEGAMTLSKQSFEGFTEPVTLWSEGMMTISKDVPCELFCEKVSGLYIFGQLSVPKALHAAALMRAKRVEGNLSAKGSEEDSDQAENEDLQMGNVKVIGNAVEFKLI